MDNNNTIDNELIPAKDNPSQEMTLDQLPPLLPQQRLMLNYILEGSDYISAYRKAGYKAQEQYEDRSCHILVTRNPLKAHLEYFQKEISKLITPAYIANKLARIADKSTNDEEMHLYSPEIALKAYDQLNKMAGNYAATQVNVQTLTASVEDIRNARQEYKQDK
jgi:hypothetical protein